MMIRWLAYTAFLFATGARASPLVDTTGDTVDADPADGVCADALGACSFRAAIQQANAGPGPDVVVLPAGTFQLALDGRGEDAGALGDLDVGDDIAPIGVGSDATIVDADARDRVVDLLDGVAEVRLEGLTLRNGLIVDSESRGIRRRDARRGRRARRARRRRDPRQPHRARARLGGHRPCGMSRRTSRPRPRQQ